MIYLYLEYTGKIVNKNIIWKYYYILQKKAYIVEYRRALFIDKSKCLQDN